MLLYPSINILNEKTDSRYTLCILTAKRARDIIDGKPILTSNEQERAVSQAAVEIADDCISYKRIAPEKSTDPEKSVSNDDVIEEVKVD